MLQPNPLDPPRACDGPASAAARTARPGGPVFISAEDYDGTGILAGFDPCASNFWWMPELHATDPADPSVAAAVAVPPHATRRTPSRPQAAA